MAHVEAELQRSRWKQYETTIPAFRALARSFSLAQLIYREVRSGAIHEHGFGVDERRFFTDVQPYVDAFSHAYDDTLYLGVSVPGRWLIDLLRSCVHNYKRRLLETRQLPGDLWSEICEPLHDVEYLDEESLPDERIFGPGIGR
jgi:hypothetical protein